MTRPIGLQPRRRAWPCLAGLLVLASCTPAVWPPPWPSATAVAVGTPLAIAAVAEVTSIAVLHRGIFDTLYSAGSGKDCSIVYLDRGESYCKPQQPPPLPPPYCTRSLGVVDCWSNPEALVNLPPQVANGPLTLTPAQEANRTQRWPPL